MDDKNIENLVTEVSEWSGAIKKSKMGCLKYKK